MARIRITLVSITVALLMCGLAYGKSRPRYQLRTQGPAVDSREWLENRPRPDMPKSRVFGHRIGVGATTTPGTWVGSTYYDYQHNNSTGRQVDEFSGLVQVSWMRAPGPSDSIRTVNWNATAIVGSAMNVLLDNGDTVHVFPMSSAGPNQGVPFAAIRPGYTNMRLTPTGSAVVGFHDAPETGGVQFWAAHVDLSVGNGVFGIQQRSPNPAGPEYQADSPIWPKFAISECGGEIVHHAIGTWSGARNEIWYWRGVITGSEIDWSGMQDNLPTLVEPTDATLSAVIEAHGDEVTIALFKQVGTVNADVIRYESTDCGLTWPDSLSYENITNYTDNHLDGAGNHLSAAYDDAGDIHVLWDTAPSTGLAHPTNLYHWSGSSGIHQVTSADWINRCGGPFPLPNNGAGSRNLAISDVEISVKPAGLGPGAGIVEELFYAVWTQYGPSDTDCATLDDQGTLGGYTNAEIYCSVSSNGGITWDRPTNLTGTVTPDCNPGECLSESWITAAATADSGIYISYVLDLHAGGAVVGEGVWTENPYMVLAVEARLPVLEPVIGVTPRFFNELNADPGGGSNTVDLYIASEGNADLSYTVTVTDDDGGGSHVMVNGGPIAAGTILAGDAPHVVTVTYDCVGLGDPEELAWRLEITSNDIENDPGQGGTPIDVILQVFSASSWYTCDEDTLSTGHHVMQVSSCLEMGDVGTLGLGFYDAVRSEEWLYSGSPLVTLVTEGGDTVAYHNAHMNVAERTRAENKSFRAQSDFRVTRDSVITVGDSTYTADVAQGLWSTTDTTIGGTFEIVFPKASSHNDGAFWKFTMETLTGADIPNVSYGVIADIDVDLSGIFGGAGENAGVVSQEEGWVGATFNDTNIFTHSSWFMAVFHLPLNVGCPKDEGVAGQVLSNSNYVMDRYDVDSLYMLTQLFGGAGTWSSNIHIDTGQRVDDVSVLLVSGYNENLVQDSQITWGYGIAVSDISVEGLTERINIIRLLASAECQKVCTIEIAGDVNLSTVITSADILYMVDYVFKDGDAPLPCEANGDVNCSGELNSADIIFLVGHVFKNGPAPCDICSEPIAQACTP